MRTSYLETSAYLLESFLKELSAKVKNGKIINAIADKKVYKGKVVQGTQFQLALLHQITQFISITGLVSKFIVSEIQYGLTELLWEKYQRAGFSYLEDGSLPPDLDTLSATVCALSHIPEVMEHGRDIIKTAWKGEFPTVFLAPNQATAEAYGEAFHCGTNLWHIDVLINALIAEHLSGVEFLAIDPHTITKLVPINFWYIPCSFSYFRLAQLCRLKSISLHKRSFDELNHTSSVKQMQKVFTARKCHSLENFMYIAATGGEIHCSLFEIVNALEEDEPILYPSAGFKPYRSRILYNAFFFLAVSHILQPRTNIEFTH